MELMSTLRFQDYYQIWPPQCVPKMTKEQKESEELLITPRRVWGAARSRFRRVRDHRKSRQPYHMRLPISYVFTGTTMTDRCGLMPECLPPLLLRQQRDMRTMPDIAFNFLINDAGDIFQGRGWKKKPRLPAPKFRDMAYSSLYIGFIGDFRATLPTDDMINAKRRLIKYGMDRKFIADRILDFDGQMNYKQFVK